MSLADWNTSCSDSAQTLRSCNTKKCRVSTCCAETLFCWSGRLDPRREPVQQKQGEVYRDHSYFQSFTLCHCRIFQIATKPCFDIWTPQWLIYLFIYLFSLFIINDCLRWSEYVFIYLFVYLLLYCSFVGHKHFGAFLFYFKLCVNFPTYCTNNK